ncbi:hypothetical protein AAFC00_000183 [Neodothiora populina]
MDPARPTLYVAGVDAESRAEHQHSAPPIAVHDAGSYSRPSIPLDAIMPEDHLVLESMDSAFGRHYDPSDHNVDSDDEDLYEAHQHTPLAATDHASAAAVNNSIGQGPRNIPRTLRRRITQRFNVPPVLFLYDIQDLESTKPQGGAPSVIKSARCLPLKRESNAHTSRSTTSSPNYTVHPDHATSMELRLSSASRARWVPGELPVELFEAITQHLSRDDIKSMRLVSKEFERGVSHSLFNTVVVPFNTELYEMIEQDRCIKRDLDGKGSVDDQGSSFANMKLHWKNAREDAEDKVYKGHGLRVFEGFGSHIRRFGMSFEIREDSLSNPPQKKALDQLNSYFGSYDWPTTEYTRFEKLAGLERTADETSQMKLAFSYLHEVRHLALSLDSGLGWMSGPDKSMRSRILQRDPPVFGDSSHGVLSAQQKQREYLWDILDSSYSNVGKADELIEGRLQFCGLASSPSNIQALSENAYQNTNMWANLDPKILDSMDNDGPGSDDANHKPPTGLLYVKVDRHEPLGSPPPFIEDVETRLVSPDMFANCLAEADSGTRVNKPFAPANLDKHQKEWLLEAEWAQKAFLISYMLAIVDNGPVFSNVTTLNLARISSRHVPLLYRHDFWGALPSLGDLTVAVTPDWRTIEQDEAGFVETVDVKPSKAHYAFYTLLKDYIGIRRSIKKINFGWAAGGEHEEGCYGRNNHILPAPITLLPSTVQFTENDQDMLTLAHVEHLTLSNCWLSPPSLVNFVKNLKTAAVKGITFDSVSLTAHPRFTVANGGNQNAVYGQAAWLPLWGFQPGVTLAQPYVHTPAAAQQFAALFWQGPQEGQPHPVWAQTMLQQMQHMMTQNGIHNNQLGRMWSNHPAGMTLGQIAQTLGMLAGGRVLGGGVPGGFWPGRRDTTGIVGSNRRQDWQGLGRQELHQTAGGGGGPAAATVVPLLPGQDPEGSPQWYEGHQEGSWVDVIDQISPGPTLKMYRPSEEFDTAAPQGRTKLHSIAFNSCGYVLLQNAPFDQTAFEGMMSQRFTSTYFMRRRSALQSAMLSSTDRYLGRIVQHMLEREQNALLFAWGMRMGWDNVKKTEEAEYDGCLPGGTGRFSGSVHKGYRLGLAADSH